MSTESFDPSKYKDIPHKSEQKNQNNVGETLYGVTIDETIDDIHNQEQKDKEREKPDEILDSLDKSDSIQTYDTTKQIPTGEENVVDQQVSRMAYLSKQQIATGTEKEITTSPRLQGIYDMFS